METNRCGKIVWLASYPKSGNTWFRAFLTNLLSEQNDPADINRLQGGPIFSSRPVFDLNTYLQSSDLLEDEIKYLRPRIYQHISDNAEKTLFIKAHDAYTYQEDGSPLYPTSATRGVIYLIRNPLDIVPSYANHANCSIEAVISRLNDSQYAYCSRSQNLANQLQQKLGRWSEHVQSWLNVTQIPVHFIRYEDMKADPLPTFRTAIRFAGLNHSDNEIEQALEACRFEKLQQQENTSGFREKSMKVKNFFRRGQVGSWQESLSNEQANQITRDHQDIMRKFHYLDTENKVIGYENSAISLKQTAILQKPVMYDIYGISISLPFRFDELPRSNARQADITVSIESFIEPELEWQDIGVTHKAHPDYYLLEVPGIARFLLKNGTDILIDMAIFADFEAIKLILLNSILSVALIQRNALVLWGSTVVKDGNAHLILGRSSEGKSLFAAALMERGLKVASDNLCVIHSDGNLSVSPGYPFLMLWKQSLNLLDKTHDGLTPVRRGLKKFRYPLNNNHYNQSLPVSSIYILSSHNRESFEFEPATGFNKLFDVLNYTYHEHLLTALGKFGKQNQISSQLVKPLPVTHYHYLDSKEAFENSVDTLFKHIMATD